MKVNDKALEFTTPKTQGLVDLLILILFLLIDTLFALSNTGNFCYILIIFEDKSFNLLDKIIVMYVT